MTMLEDDDEEFTFAVVSPSVADGGGGGVFLSGRMGALCYPVFGRPRSPPRPPEPETKETATVRVSLAQLLLVDREPPAPQPPDDDEELDSVPAELYCPWSPGWSPATAAAAAARCRKSRSTGSVLRWRLRFVGRSQSDGKEKFVFLNTAAASGTSSRRKAAGRNGDELVGGSGGGHAAAWSYYAKGRSGGGTAGARRTSFLPYKQDLMGLFVNAAVFRRSYHNLF